MRDDAKEDRTHDGMTCGPAGRFIGLWQRFQRKAKPFGMRALDRWRSHVRCRVKMTYHPVCKPGARSQRI
jgi:hypothetical protein